MSPINAEQVNNYLIKYVHTDIMECIINFAYSFECDVNETNLMEILSTAEYFCLAALVDRCAQFIRRILNAENCISLMLNTRFSKQSTFIFEFEKETRIFIFFFHFRKCLFKHEVQRDIRQYILRNFIEITKLNEDIIYLSCADLLDLISDDALNAKNEQPIWEFCLRWIEFDEKNRIENVPSLLEGVRLGLMNQDVRHIIILLFFSPQPCDSFNAIFFGFGSTSSGVC